ncbi:MAG: hypothetical protein KIT84_36380 [Labilithrix sp.]|nr:hypothetical protein [Labilithrix sp.]MCW5816533.1 hypothetical protein [Labilithrix sp.]
MWRRVLGLGLIVCLVSGCKGCSRAEPDAKAVETNGVEGPELPAIATSLEGHAVFTRGPSAPPSRTLAPRWS